MVPFYGQGMNVGFEDLTVLTKILAESPDRAVAFETYSRTRRPDAHAICDLALYNYWEMSSGVTSWVFRTRRALYARLHQIMPRWFVPLYSMVAFSDIPHAQVVRRHARQERILSAILGSASVGFLGLLALLVTKQLNICKA